MSKLSTEDLNAAIGRRLEAIRAESGLTQIEFALQLGLSPRAYANYERGEREMPVALFRSLCDAYQVDPLWLLRGPEEAPQRISSRRFDADLFEEVIALVEGWLKKHRCAMSVEKKSLAIRLIYEDAIEKGSVDAPYARRTLDLAA